MTAAPLRFIAISMVSVITIAAIEGLVLARKARVAQDWRASMISLGDFCARELLTALGLLSVAPLFAWAWTHRLTEMTLTTTGQLAFLFVAQDFLYYWYHRTAHRCRWFWATHSIHHTPNQLNLSAAYRFGVTGRITGSTLFYLPLVWLGFSSRAVLTTLSINLLYQFWLHATWIPKLGPLEKILNTPSAHRVHHAANVEYLDGNYGGVLILFDRLFGTYIAERDDLPCRYGLVKPVNSHDIVEIELGGWLSLFRDLSQARSVRTFVMTLIGPPGWRSDGQHETTEALRRRHSLTMDPVQSLPAPSASLPAQRSLTT